MADMRGRRCVGAQAYSKEREDFVNEVLKGDDSDLRLSDDDDTFADFEVTNTDLGNENVDSSEEEEDAQEEYNSIASNHSANTRTFWKKTSTFAPLPPALEYESPEIIPVNFSPQQYVDKYLPEDMFVTLIDCTNRRYLKETGKPLKVQL